MREGTMTAWTYDHQTQTLSFWVGGDLIARFVGFVRTEGFTIEVSPAAFLERVGDYEVRPTSGPFGLVCRRCGVTEARHDHPGACSEFVPPDAAR